jgi:peptidoglycan hydrolase CwlO-like protein
MDPNKMEKTAMAVTRWIGSAQSIMLHTVVFATVIFMLVEKVFSFNVLILVFNTAVSLEAIYLALFIQMTVNYQSRSIAEVEKDIDEIQEDVEEIQEDVDEIQGDVDEIQEDVEEISEDVEEMSEEEAEEERVHIEHNKTLADIQNDLKKLMTDIEKLQAKQ